MQDGQRCTLKVVEEVRKYGCDKHAADAYKFVFCSRKLNMSQRKFSRMRNIWNVKSVYMYCSSSVVQSKVASEPASVQIWVTTVSPSLEESAQSGSSLGDLGSSPCAASSSYSGFQAWGASLKFPVSRMCVISAGNTLVGRSSNFFGRLHRRRNNNDPTQRSDFSRINPYCSKDALQMALTNGKNPLSQATNLFMGFYSISTTRHQ